MVINNDFFGKIIVILGRRRSVRKNPFWSLFVTNVNKPKAVE